MAVFSLFFYSRIYWRRYRGTRFNPQTGRIEKGLEKSQVCPSLISTSVVSMSKSLNPTWMCSVATGQTVVVRATFRWEFDDPEKEREPLSETLFLSETCSVFVKPECFWNIQMNYLLLEDNETLSASYTRLNNQQRKKIFLKGIKMPLSVRTHTTSGCSISHSLRG